MTSTCRIVSILLRGAQLASACVVAGILGHLLAQIEDADGSANDRVVYGEITAAISIVASICLMYPLHSSLWLSLSDIALSFESMMWIAATALLEDLTAGKSCTAPWFYQYWGFYWGVYWQNPKHPIKGVACGEWVAAHAFGWLGVLLWLATGWMCVYTAFKNQAESNGNRARVPWLREKSKGQHNGHYTIVRPTTSGG